MRNWKNLIRERIAPLRLTAAGEAALTEEIAQHLEDIYRDLLSGGATEEEAYRSAISELDDMYPLRRRTGEGIKCMPKHDAPPAGDMRPGNFMEGLWRDLRYAVRTMRQGPIFVLFVVLTLALGIGANTTVFTLINTLILNPLPAANPSELVGIQTVETTSTSKSSAPLPISYAQPERLSSEERRLPFAGGLHISAFDHLAAEGSVTEAVQRIGDRQLLLDTGAHAGQRTVFPARGRQHAGRAPGCGNELRHVADGFWRRGRHCRQDAAASTTSSSPS